MEFLICILIGYGLGCINPAYIISRIKGSDIRKQGSGNAGASNMLLVFGKLSAIFCALFDIAKACLAIWLCTWFYFDFEYAFVVAATACILGHMFPFYMGFRGGKGLACLGGVFIMFDWRVLLIALAIELVLALLVNYICIVPITASVAFPIIYGIMRGDLIGALIFTVATVAILIKHIENLKRIKNGKEIHLSYLWTKDKSKEIERVTKE